MTGTYRSGAATVLMWIGPVVAVVPALVFIPLPVLLMVGGAGADMLLLMAFVPVGVIAGLLLFLAGYRSRVVVAEDSVSWRTATSSAGPVPFSAVRQVEVPTARRGPRSVRLHLQDGTVVPVAAASMSGGEGGNSPDRGYLRIASAITDAHRSWWMRNAPQR